MYHILTLGSLTISMTGLGVIIFVGVFLGVTGYATRSHQTVNFGKFFRYSPVIIITTYLTSAWAWYLTNELILLPTSVEQLLLYLSPAGREFSLLGIIIGCFISFESFLRTQTPQQQTIRIDIFFKALCRGMIPLGIFLVLGDAFIGMPTQSSIGVSAIRPESAVALYDKVLPLGLGVSLLGIIGIGFESFAAHRLQRGHGYAGLAWILLGLAFLTLYQNYARRVLTLLGDIRFDIKQYLLIGLAVWLFIVRKTKRIPSNQ